MNYPNEAFVIKEGTRVSIGNGQVVRVFSTEQNRLHTEKIINRRIENGLEFAPAKSSEEFIIQFLGGLFSKPRVVSSACELESVEIKDEAEKSVLFQFKPYSVCGTNLHICVRAYIGEKDLVVRKTISLSAENPKRCKLDYIDLEHLVLGNDIVQKWSRPDMDKAYLSKFQSALGQPIYLNGMFTGSEFPATDNQIADDVAYVRYYSGKTLAELTKDDDAYTTWPTIFGSARSTEQAVIRADFLAYIRSIAQPIYLRTQYNSWYDHMLDIDHKNINDSFFEIEKGLSSNGVPPVHSYVVDDGFHDYDKPFWCFNEKFPNELYDSSALAKHFASNFGLWIGPRGGYNSKTPTFARKMEKAGMGGMNRQAMDVCVADHRYLKNLDNLFIDYMDRFDINYWKLDGFLLKPCKNKHHGHPTGGYEGMYCFTECWENWVRIFKHMHEHRKAQGKDLWINQTSYCNASPWFLQWSESLWIQNSGDIGFVDKTKDGVKLEGKDFDRMLTYRDGRYFNFCREREYQFPLSNIYNHEPIYGNTAKIKMTDDEFRKYMYMIATRGTAFWELYYSYNLFTPDMWKINADVLRFLRENFYLLRNAKLLGETPEIGAVYGYAGFEDANGIMSLRNPANQKQSISIVLDRNIGVGETASSMQFTTILPYTKEISTQTYSYGDTLTLELEPHEIRIFRFGVPEKTVSLVDAKFLNATTAEFRFDGHVLPKRVLCNGKEVAFSLQANYSDVQIAFPESMEGQVAEFSMEATDIYGRPCDCSAKITCYKGNQFPKAVHSVGDFTVTMELSNAPKDGVLYLQGNDLQISMRNGKIVAECKGTKAKSDIEVSGIEKIKASVVRERNGMLKIYADGKLGGAGYNPERVNPLVSGNTVQTNDCVKAYTLYNQAFSFQEI